jgi:uncharacterized protein (DUF697 family)
MPCNQFAKFGKGLIMQLATMAAAAGLEPAPAAVMVDRLTCQMMRMMRMMAAAAARPSGD